MRRFADWLFSDWRLAIVLPLIVAAVFVACPDGGSLFTAIEARSIAARRVRCHDNIDRELRKKKQKTSRAAVTDRRNADQ